MFKISNRYTNYFYELIQIKFKTLKEYKINFYLDLIPHIIFMILVSFIYFTLKKSFPNVIYWSLEEFIFFLIYLEIFLFLFESFFKYLRKDLISGNFNSFLTKPLNSFFTQGISNTNPVGISIGIIYILLLIPYFIYYGLQTLNFIISFLFGIFGGLFLVTIRIFINNLALHIKENQFINKIYFYGIMNTFTTYPPNFFKSSQIYKFTFIVMISYYGSIPTDFYFGYINFQMLLKYFYILISLILLINLISYFFWKFGLKKYEGYS